MLLYSSTSSDRCDSSISVLSHKLHGTILGVGTALAVATAADSLGLLPLLRAVPPRLLLLPLGLLNQGLIRLIEVIRKLRGRWGCTGRRRRSRPLRPRHWYWARPSTQPWSFNYNPASTRLVHGARRTSITVVVIVGLALRRIEEAARRVPLVGPIGAY